MDSPYAVAVREILYSASFAAEDRCIACNLCHDSRISDLRQIELFEYHRKGIDRHPLTGVALRDSFRDFFKYRIRLTRNPDYVRRDLNAGNIVRCYANPRRPKANPFLPRGQSDAPAQSAPPTNSALQQWNGDGRLDRGLSGASGHCAPDEGKPLIIQ